MDEVVAFYDALADEYTALFADWDASVVRQGGIIGGIIRARSLAQDPTVLDATCGIGTQAIGLALGGWRVVASDVSPSSIGRARKEAARLGARVVFDVADVRALPDPVDGPFDVAISFDNALPHLVEPADLTAALSSLHRVLRCGGLLVLSIRDYDAILASRPSGESPRISGRPPARRMVVQAWEWDAMEPIYRLHQFVLRELPGGDWTARHFETRYRAITRSDLGAAARDAGFSDIEWLEPRETHFYQPIMVARRPCSDP